MSHRPDTERFTETIQHLSRLRQYRAQQPPISHVELDDSLARLRAWQSTRLARTHADLLASHRYGPACRFFLTEIYAPRDFSQRDQDIEYLYAVMSGFLPEFLLKVVRKAIEMNDLTNELDQELSRVLVEDAGREWLRRSAHSITPKSMPKRTVFAITTPSAPTRSISSARSAAWSIAAPTSR